MEKKEIFVQNSFLKQFNFFSQIYYHYPIIYSKIHPIHSNLLDIFMHKTNN